MSNFNFRQSAQETVSNSTLQVGRTKGKLDDLEGKIVTVWAVDRNMGPAVDSDNNIIVDPDTGEIKETLYTTVIFKEYPETYYGGCNELDRIIDAWLSAFNSVSECNEALQAEGGVRIKGRMERKRGKNMRKFEIL